MKFELKAGRYICIDPCYIYPDEEWSDLCGCFEYEGFEKKKGNCRSLTPVSQCSGLEMFYKDSRFIVIGTAYGDGCYPIKKGRQTIGTLGVDAGLLAVIPLELAASWPEFEKNKRLGVIVEVKNDTTLEAKNGDFSFGGFSVETGGTEDEDFN